MLLEHHYSALVLVLRPGGMVYGAGGRGPRPAPGARACGLRRVLRVPRTAAIAVLRHTDTARTLATETHLIRVLCNCQVTAKCAIPVATAERRFCGHCRLFWILGIVHIACHIYRRMAAPCNCKHARPAKPEPSDDRESHPRRTPMSRGWREHNHGAWLRSGCFKTPSCRSAAGTGTSPEGCLTWDQRPRPAQAHSGSDATVPQRRSDTANGLRSFR